VAAYYKKTYNADGINPNGRNTISDPSVNHLIFGKGLDGATVRIGPSTDSDLHELHFRNGISQLYYVMWMGKEGYEYPPSAFQEALEAIVGKCELSEAKERPTASGGGGGGSVALVVVILLLVVALLGVAAYGYKAGWFAGMGGKLPGMRARTTPNASRGPANPMSTAPLSSTTPTAGLAGRDSAAEGFSTAYTPPPS